MRFLSLRSAFASLFLLAVVLGGACSSDGGKKTSDGTTPGGAAAPTTAPLGPEAFTITGMDVQAMAPQAPAFPTDVSAAVKTSLDTWLGRALTAPLRTGKPSSGLEDVFTGPALLKISAAGTERAALLEEGTPLTGKVRQDRADAKLTAVAAPGGDVVLVTAQIDLSLSVSSGDGAVDVVRTGELVLVPDRGSWRIDAFDMVTKRDTRAAGK